MPIKTPDQNLAIPSESSPQDDRRRYRSIFWSAYKTFQELAVSIVHAQAIDYECVTTSDRTGAYPLHVSDVRDWLEEFDLAGSWILRNRERDLRIFKKHFLMGYSGEAMAKELGIVYGGNWREILRGIAERVGGELDRRELWPLRQRFDGKSYLV